MDDPWKDDLKVWESGFARTLNSVYDNPLAIMNVPRYGGRYLPEGAEVMLKELAKDIRVGTHDLRERVAARVKDILLIQPEMRPDCERCGKASQTKERGVYACWDCVKQVRVYAGEAW